ncbi:tryptophan--tRNA ligase [Thermogladius sp. 4427co]|uniref:tryptophan--tRNA ligase n=1 Tax=Thermogladius sp. 4427co TaxID=3450718 RepID=UPI003F78E6BB
MDIRIDPWDYKIIQEYDKLFTVFGIQSIDSIPYKDLLKHHFFTRRIVFGHRDFDKWLNALRRGDKVIVLTGFMPSGVPHLGTAMVFEELKFFQEIGASVKIVIADAEAYAVRREDRGSTIKHGIEFIKHAIAWGIDPNKSEFYFQTAMKESYYRLIQMFSRKVTAAEMEAIYGDLTPAKIMAALTQVADILHPQLEEFGGYKHVLVPVGVDQDPHLRFARDIADRFSEELGFERPSSTYHKLLRGLDGNKMSKSRPDYAIFLNDDENVVRKKVMMALTGGRATAEEQRRLGGEPWKCMIHELYVYFMLNDEDVRKITEECVTGRILCGECKRIAVELLVGKLKEHKKKYEEVERTFNIEKIVKIPAF